MSHHGNGAVGVAVGTWGGCVAVAGGSSDGGVAALGVAVGGAGTGVSAAAGGSVAAGGAGGWKLPPVTAGGTNGRGKLRTWASVRRACVGEALAVAVVSCSAGFGVLPE